MSRKISPTLLFVTSNPNKALEVRKILDKNGISFQHNDTAYKEIQSSSLKTIATESARCLYERLKTPLFVEDSGLFIETLGGFPGPYSSYVYKTIGNSGVLKLMSAVTDRTSRFESVVAYAENDNDIHLFSGIVLGRIADKKRGKGWGFDPIFIPRNFNETYAEMGIESKQRVSHRYVAFTKFSNWFKTRG
jgi:XTP/dITP diphosphohydrolase